MRLRAAASMPLLLATVTVALLAIACGDEDASRPQGAEPQVEEQMPAPQAEEAPNERSDMAGEPVASAEGDAAGRASDGEPSNEAEEGVGASPEGRPETEPDSEQSPSDAGASDGMRDGPTLQLVQVESGEVRELFTTRSAADGLPWLGVHAWAPDGQRLAVADARGVWLVPVTGGEPELLTSQVVTAMDWAPTGDQIAIVSPGAALILDVATTDRTIVATGRWEAALWNDAGDALLLWPFAAPPAIWRDGELIQLELPWEYIDVERTIWAGWLNDGRVGTVLATPARTITYQVAPSDPSASWTGLWQDAEMVVITTTGTTFVASDVFSLSAPHPSPYGRLRNHTDALDAEGDRIATFDGQPWGFRGAFPSATDGRVPIVVNTCADRPLALRVYDEGALTTVWTDPEDDDAWIWAAAWSPDERLLAFTTMRGDLIVVPADGSSTPRTIASDAGGAGLAWSPDGAWVSFWSPTGGTSCA